MRSVHLADIEAVARVLLLTPAHDRMYIAHTIYDRAVSADKYRKRHQRPHPDFGTGSLMSAAAHYPQGLRPSLDQRDFIECLRIVIEVLTLGRGNHNV